MDKRIGIYIHIPFCAGKCAYCDFYSVAHRDKFMPEYQKALLKHIREYAPQLSGYLIDTVYFGGGTPSHYGADRLIELFSALKKNGRVLLDAEVTLEANPESVNKQDLIRLRRAGFNRISFGMQSANDKMLRTIGRLHNFARVEHAVADARAAGFKNISLDLMYGLPSQTKDDWATTLLKAQALKPDHISCYGLKLEPGTQLYMFKDTPFIPDDDTQADMYLYAVETLARNGFKQYEISNFAKRGCESRHNMKYWRCEEYIGFGAAAHSYVGGRRYSNVSNLDVYCRCIDSGESVVDQSESILDNERASEYIMLALRTTMGISVDEYRMVTPMSMEFVERKLEEFKSHGWAECENGRWHFTPEGFLISNTLINELFEMQMMQRALHSKRTDPSVDLNALSDMPKPEQDSASVFKGI